MVFYVRYRARQWTALPSACEEAGRAESAVPTGQPDGWHHVRSERQATPHERVVRLLRAWQARGLLLQGDEYLRVRAHRLVIPPLPASQVQVSLRRELLYSLT